MPDTKKKKNILTLFKVRQNSDSSMPETELIAANILESTLLCLLRSPQAVVYKESIVHIII